MQMFIQNKYTRWYQQIIESAKSNPYNGYTERHHTIPRSLGGVDSDENLVRLSGRQHFICHWLLTKMTEGQDWYKMINAMAIMKAESTYQERYNTKITSRAFAYIREEYAKYISDMNTGTKLTEEQCEKVRQSKLGKKREEFSEEWKENLSKNHKSKNLDYDCSLREETKKKIGDKNRGRKQTEEEKKQRGDSVRALRLKREKKYCVHCDRWIAINGYVRFHGDKCKKRII